MLSYKDVVSIDAKTFQDDVIPITACAECKPIIVTNRNNLIVYSNQSAQISFGLNNIPTPQMI